MCSQSYWGFKGSGLRRGHPKIRKGYTHAFPAPFAPHCQLRQAPAIPM